MLGEFIKERELIGHERDLSDKAVRILEDIIRKDSKESAVKEFVEANHRAIVNIYTRIHAPKEFGDILFEKEKIAGE